MSDGVRRVWRRIRGMADRALPRSIGRRLRLIARSTGDAAMIGLPRGRRFVVVAPHPDDEVIMCGGTIALLTAAGAQVTVVAVTDGERGGDASLAPAVVAERRRAEQEQACASLGVHDVIRLGLPDGGLADRRAALGSLLGDRLLEIEPSAVIVPWWGDDHPDHEAAADALAAVVGDHVEVWCAEVWTPLVPNRIVDITAGFERKRAALAFHETAQAAFEVDSLLGLSRYRSAFGLRGRGHAEAFLALTGDAFRSAVAEHRR